MEQGSWSTMVEEEESRCDRPQPRPALKREDATLGGDRYINDAWSQAIFDAEAGTFVPRNSVSPGSKPLITQERPQEQPLTGLVNTWWANRLRAEATSFPRNIVATSGHRELPVASKNPEIWLSPPSEGDIESHRLFPQPRTESTKEIFERVEAWRNKFLKTLPLGSSPVEQPHSPRRATFINLYDPNAPGDAAQAGLVGDMDKAAWKFLESSHLDQKYDPETFAPEPVRQKSSYLDQEEDLGTLLPEPLQPTKNMESTSWSSAPVNRYELVSTASGWDFVSSEPLPDPENLQSLTHNKPYGDSNVAFRSSQPDLEPTTIKTVGLNPSASLPWDPLSQNPLVDYEEMDVDLDQSNDDDPTSTTESWERGSASDSSDQGEDDDTVVGSDDDENFQADYSDPVSRLAPHEDLPPRPASPEPEEFEFDTMENIKQAKAVEEWMKEQRLRSGNGIESANIAEQSSLPDDEVEDAWAHAFLPASVLENDPRYANQTDVMNPRLAQITLITRALDPERRHTRYPRRNTIVVHRAQAAVDAAQAFMMKFLATVEEDHEMEDVSSNS